MKKRKPHFPVDIPAYPCYNHRAKGSRSGGPALTASIAKRSIRADPKGISAFFRVPLRHPLFFMLEAFHISKLDHQLNEDIRDKEIRVIGSDGEMLGIMAPQTALDMAYDQGLDLVKIAPNATPPVCKIIDYGKYRFEQSKKEKEAKKNQHVTEVKEIRMSPGIDIGDFNVKVRNAQKFLNDGNRVKVTVRFRGREMAHTDIGRNLLVQFGEACSEIANVEKNPKLDGRHMSMFLGPKPQSK